MRQASWNEMFASRGEPTTLAPQVPQEPRGWRRLFWWEDLLTFGLLGAIFLTVIGAIDQARWVDDMPSLFPIASLGLLMGALLARVRWPEGFVHLLAISVGAAAALGQILAVIPGPHPVARFETLTTRMGAWFDAAFTGGISNDDLPFIVLVVALSWLGAYLSSWAAFRWQNAWLALIPGGTALLMHISFLPGQFSFTFVVFLFGGALLITRLHLMERARAWRQDGTPYPEMLSLSVLHATFWLAVVLVSLAWLLPQANEAQAVESVWRKATAPVTERMEGISRLFISVSSRKGVSVHRYDDVLPFLGAIELPETKVLEVTTEPLGQPRYLRARTYYFYTPTGWKRGSSQTSSLDRYAITAVDELLQLRQAITSRIITAGHTGDTILTIGQPRRVDEPVRLQWWAIQRDILGVDAKDRLREGSVYESVGSISVAPEVVLRAAGSDYPGWVLARYLQLPSDFPSSVSNLAGDLAAREATAYGQATAIERYLRAIPYDLDVPNTPLGEDAVEYFLFEAERGYFDYHASAMVVMLRSVGIPARLAVGYALRDEERAASTDRYTVTEQSAFAWPEVYFPGLGWVEFNPTPSLPTVERPSAVPIAAIDGDSDSESSGDLGFGALEDLFPDDGGTGLENLETASSSDRNRWVLIGVMAGLATIAVAAAGGLRYAWLRELSGLAPPARLWGQTVRLASWSRIPPAPHQTPREFARSLREEVPDLSQADVLADAYVRHRFAEQPEEAEAARLEEAWRSVRAALLRRLLRLR